MTKKIVSSIVLSFISLSLLAQKRTLLKFEFPVSILTDQAIQTVGQPLSIMYPTLYIPLHKHIDIGAGYTNQKDNYYVKETAGTTSNYFSGSVKFKVTSFYLKINLSASQKRVNPFFGYILSFSKGTYTSPTPYTGQVTQNFVYNNNFEYGEPCFGYSTRMTTNEENILKKAIAKSQLSHGAQFGLDFRIVPFINLFLKTTTFSILGYQKTSKKEYPFSIYYKEQSQSPAPTQEKTFHFTPQMHFMGGIILKIDAGKKSLIK